MRRHAYLILAGTLAPFAFLADYEVQRLPDFLVGLAAGACAAAFAYVVAVLLEII